MFRVTIIWKALEKRVTYVVMSEQKAWADVSEAEHIKHHLKELKYVIEK